MASKEGQHVDGETLDERATKRQKLETSDDPEHTTVDSGHTMEGVEQAESQNEVHKTDAALGESLLPPSRVLLGESPVSLAASAGHTLEFDVGISEYISKDLSPIHAIIKQRFTDFLVNEVDLDGNVIHIQSLDMPSSEGKKKANAEDTVAIEENTDPREVPTENIDDNNATLDQPAIHLEAVTPSAKPTSQEPWPERFNEALKPYLTEEQIALLKQIYLEGPEPPFVSDSGWVGRQSKTDEGESLEPATSTSTNEEKANDDLEMIDNEKGKRGKRGRDRGGRGGRGRGRGRGGRSGGTTRDDHRKVVSNPMESKTDRTGLHKIIRELFNGKLDSETDTSKPDEEGRIVIKWARRGQGRDAGRGGRGGRGGGESRNPRGTYPPYIHFTLQKTNRDTQDALAHLSRVIRCNVKEFASAGTKDKRGVTVQRISLKRNNKTVEDVWKLVNLQNGRRTAEEAVKQRGERGIRLADFKYRKAGLDLGMLKGNVFLITLRNVQVERLDVLDKAMESLKKNGFINYYGMQRFGTAAIPTHAIGLALLQSDWHKAVDLLLRHRPGEHPDVVAARDAWLVEKDLDKALKLMPRRVVAERCILESYKKQNGETRNAMGALSTIPRNLRLMYVHAYQSYVWNAIVSERIRTYGAEKPVPGDLVYEKEGGRVIEKDEELVQEDDDDAEDRQTGRRSKRPWVAPQVKTLTEEDVDKYSIFDVIMPLPGIEVAYPGDSLGVRYREFLKLDGLDPDNFQRKQKEYCLTGSYRKILHLPKDLSWSTLRYTDPDVPLAQSDEDKLLGIEPPVVDENGKFIALQVKMQLGTASYATMALREVTKTETSSHYQTSLTQASEDQVFRGTGGVKDEDEMEA